MKEIVRKGVSVLAACILLVVIAISSFVYFTARWFIKTFGLLTVDEIVYHMKTSISGTNTDMIKDYMKDYGIWVFLITLALFGVYLVIAYKVPRYRTITYVLLIVLSMGSIVFAYHILDSALGVTDYLKQEFFADPNEQDDFVAEHYVDTSSVDIRFPEDGSKRNLIYIWLESMETTYADAENGGAFEQNLIPEMTELAETNEDFSSDDSKLNGGVALPGANWTMGAMFAQTSGLPLKIPFASRQMEDQSDFYPTLRTLGDILEDNGYNQTFLLGSEAEFGGMKLYFTGHGDYKIRDYPYAIAHGDIPEDYYEFWGYEDEKLYEYAKDELTKLAAQGKPFNLSMVTADTHFEDGYVCRLCQNEFGDDQYANVMACASRQLTTFIKWVQEQDFYENTTIVISGDHPTMDSDFCVDVPGDYQRCTYTCILNSAATRADDSPPRAFSTMDLFPTTLAAMGCSIEGDQLGLGVNLYSAKETLLETYGISVLKSKLSRRSELMNELSGVRFSESLLENTREKLLVVSAEENGCIRYTVRRLYKYLTLNLIDRLYIHCVYEDPETGAKNEKTYDCDLVLENPDDPNEFVGTVLTEIPYDRLENVQASVYITIDEFKDYLLGEYDHEADLAWQAEQQ